MAKKISTAKRNKIAIKVAAGEPVATIAKDLKISVGSVRRIGLDNNKYSTVVAKHKDANKPKQVIFKAKKKDVLATGTVQEKRELLIRLLTQDVLNG